MAEFVMKCPHCQAELAAAEEWRGMEVECPTCQKTFTVPARQREAFEAKPVSPSSPGSAEEAAGNGGTFTFICPACEAVAELPAALLGKKYECQKCFEESIAQATTERQCPICGQTIKYHAAICKFCKTDLTKLPPETGKAKPAEEEKFIFICPECDSVAELPLSMKGRNYECKMCCESTVAEPAEERKCPSCGEKIKIKATVCKHCKKPAPPPDSDARFRKTERRTADGIVRSTDGIVRSVWEKLLRRFLRRRLVHFGAESGPNT